MFLVLLVPVNRTPIVHGGTVEAGRGHGRVEVRQIDAEVEEGEERLVEEMDKSGVRRTAISCKKSVQRNEPNAIAVGAGSRTQDPANACSKTTNQQLSFGGQAAPPRAHAKSLAPICNAQNIFSRDIPTSLSPHFALL